MCIFRSLVQMVLEASKGTSYTGDIAVDQLSLRFCCKLVMYTCMHLFYALELLQLLRAGSVLRCCSHPFSCLLRFVNVYLQVLCLVSTTVEVVLLCDALQMLAKFFYWKNV